MLPACYLVTVGEGVILFWQVDAMSELVHIQHDFIPASLCELARAARAACSLDEYHLRCSEKGRLTMRLTFLRIPWPQLRPALVVGVPLGLFQLFLALLALEGGFCCKKSGRPSMGVRTFPCVQLRRPLQTRWQ
jgi:hypothetical protein